MQDFPSLTHVRTGQCPLHVDSQHWSKIKAVATRIFGRTGADCWFKLRSDQVVFGYRRQGGGDLRLIGHCNFRIYKGPGYGTWFTFDAMADGVSEDDVIAVIMLARVDQRKKDRWAAEIAARGKHEQGQMIGRHLDSEMRVVEADRKFRARANVSVNGTKGAF